MPVRSVPGSVAGAHCSLPGEPGREHQAGKGAGVTEYPIYCIAETYAATRETPAEYCENEVEHDGDFCARHEHLDD